MRGFNLVTKLACLGLASCLSGTVSAAADGPAPDFAPDGESWTVYESILAHNGADGNAQDEDSTAPDGDSARVHRDPVMSNSEIGRELSNPVTALRSISNDIEYRTYQGDLPGSDGRSGAMFLFTPSIPFRLNNGKNLLLRATIPLYLDQPIWEVNFGDPIWELDRSYPDWLLRQSPQVTASTGKFNSGHDHLADISFDIAYGGVSDRGLISMYGLAFVTPTSMDISASRDQWLVGPELALGKSADWGVAGAWLTHLTDVAGDSSFSTNETSVKVFFSYGLGNGWQVISNPTITYDWEADGGNKLLLPIGAGIAKTTRWGRLPVRFAFEIENYIVSPDRFGTEWLFKLNFTPVFPGSARW
jgi:hypothetical protein